MSEKEISFIRIDGFLKMSALSTKLATLILLDMQITNGNGIHKGVFL